MVRTTDSAVTPATSKRKSLADTDFDDSEYDISEEDTDDVPKRTRTKGAKVTAQTKSRRSQSRVKRARNHTSIEHVDGEDSAGPRSVTSSSVQLSRRMRSLVAGGKPKLSRVRKSRLAKRDLGKLSRVTELPVEIFCEIAKHFEPDDLLRLSRASRALRAFLMSKSSSRSIWIACISAMGMPPCPSDLSEPQYANLYFEKDCHACSYPRVATTMDHLRIRLCKGCSKLNIFSGKKLAEDVVEDFGVNVWVMYEMFSLVPWTSMDLNEESFKEVNSSCLYRYFLKHDFLELVEAYLNTRPNSMERKEFVEKRHKLLLEITKSVRDVRAWQSEQIIKRAQTEEELKNTRKNEIIKRLISLGYTYDDVTSMQSLPDDCEIQNCWVNLVQQPKELTDRVWKTLLPKLEDLFGRKKQYDHDMVVRQNRERRFDEVTKLYKEYLELSDKTNTTLGCDELISHIAPLKDLIEEEDSTVEMTRERWRPIEEMLPELIESHYRKFALRFRDILLSTRQSVDNAKPIASSNVGFSVDAPSESGMDVNIVCRANALFYEDYHESQCLSFADVLAMRRSAVLCQIDCFLWRLKQFNASHLTLTVADAILSSMGLADSTTMEQMMAHGRGLVCQQCDPWFRKRLTWKELVGHVVKELISYRNKLKRGIMPLLEHHRIIATEESLAAVDYDLVGPPEDSLTKMTSWCCTICDDGFKHEEDVVAHLRAHHGIVEAEP